MPDLSQAFLAAAGRHFLAWSLWRRRLGAKEVDQDPIVISCFVVIVEGVWFLVTAGHVIRDIRQAIADGCSFENGKLGDSWAAKRFPGASYPHGFMDDHWDVAFNEDNGLDYAVSFLSELTVGNLNAAGVLPITEEICKAPPFSHMSPWLMVGIPRETVVQLRPRSVWGGLTMIPLEPVDSPPAPYEKRPRHFYGKIRDRTIDGKPGVQDIDGMSGGPVFGVTSLGDGTIQYWALGVQSQWYDKTRVVAFCPLAALIQEIKAILVEAQRELDAENAER